MLKPIIVIDGGLNRVLSNPNRTRKGGNHHVENDFRKLCS
nr:MAG TPA: hypothetical protein [Bacteriophage sp.]